MVSCKRFTRRERRRTAHRGFIILELVVCVTVLGFLLVVFAQLMETYERANQRYAWRQAAAWAADAQLQRYLAGAAFDSVPPEGTIPPRVHLATTVQPGEGVWSELDLVTVTARVDLRRQRPIEERAVCYLPRRSAP